MAWKLNVFTGRLDYHKVGTYQAFADANVTTWLIATGLMVPAPAVPQKAKDVHFDGAGDRHIGDAGDEHFDWKE